MEKLDSAVNEILKIEKGTGILLESGTGPYFEANIDAIKKFQKNGLSGVYLSLQKQFKTVFSLLKKQNIDLDKIVFIEPASKENQEKSSGYLPISPELDIDEAIRAIYTSLEKIEGQKFLFIDSLTMLALHMPISQTLKFAEFLVRLIKSEQNIILILSATKDLSRQEYIQAIFPYAGKTIEIEI